MPALIQGISSALINPRLQSPIEPLAIPVYLLLVTWTCVTIAMIGLTSFTWNGADLNGLIIALGTFVVGGVILRRYGLRISGALEAFGLISLGSLLSTISMSLLSALSFPMTDELLVKADKLLGFDWLNFWNLLNQQPSHMGTLTTIYHSINWQPVVLFSILFMIGRDERCWTMLTAWMIGLVFTAVLFPFFPAEAAFNHYGVIQPQGSSAANFLPTLEALRDGSLRDINRSSVQGMVTFPSFHAAAGVYFAWAAAGVKWLRVPFIVLNIAMIISAIPVGGHYLVDLIGGCLLAGVTIFAAIRIQSLVPRIWATESNG